jgi:hypothetical protein
VIAHDTFRLRSQGRRMAMHLILHKVPQKLRRRRSGGRAMPLQGLKDLVVLKNTPKPAAAAAGAALAAERTMQWW